MKCRKYPECLCSGGCTPESVLENDIPTDINYSGFYVDTFDLPYKETTTDHEGFMYIQGEEYQRQRIAQEIRETHKKHEEVSDTLDEVKEEYNKLEDKLYKLERKAEDLGLNVHYTMEDGYTFTKEY